MCTFRRPTDLAVALPALLDQAVRNLAPTRLIIVDNDPGAGARKYVEEQAASSIIGIEYVHAPEPGISVARNAALRAATEEDVLVFIDDDELPSAQWLPLLTQYWIAHRPAAVTGPVRTEFASAPEAWVTRADAFTRQRFATGSRRPGAATNNLLLDVAFVRTHGLIFDDRLGLIGGEDTMFTHQIVALGGEIHWCDEAEVIDRLPPHRGTKRWVLRRAFRSGASWARAELAVTRCWGWRAVSLTALGFAKLGIDAALYLTARLTGDQVGTAKALLQGASHVGLLSGLTPFQIREYRRAPKGSRGVSTPTSH